MTTSEIRCNCCSGTRHAPLFESKGYRLVRCDGCGLAFIANPPSAEELARLYSASDGDYHTELHDAASPAARRMMRVAETHLRFVRRVATTGRLVDVGCSTGNFIGLASTAGFAASGIEFSADSAGCARKATGLDVETGAIHDSALPPASIDVLTMYDVIEHVPDPTADLRAAWRLLRPGGWLVLSTPNIDGLFPRASLPLAKALDYWPHPEPPYHLYQFSVASLRALLVKAGFAPGRVWHRNIDLAYSFGTLRTLARMPKRLAYAAVFAPLAKLGPVIGLGDWFYIAAQKTASSDRS